jgi:hypothetical protein
VALLRDDGGLALLLGAAVPFLAVVVRTEGPAVHPAQGIALGNEAGSACPSAQRANSSMNNWPVGPTCAFDFPTFPGRCPGLGEWLSLRPGRLTATILAAKDSCCAPGVVGLQFASQECWAVAERHRQDARATANFRDSNNIWLPSPPAPLPSDGRGESC